jgi:hypothetical protein
MPHFAITFESEVSARTCALCDHEVGVAAGPRLCLGENFRPVCHSCGKVYAPPLTALLDMAQAAHRIGVINRHALTPPLRALLDLAQVAENYAYSLPTRDVAQVGDKRPSAAR